jgi:hypothetical protein
MSSQSMHICEPESRPRRQVTKAYLVLWNIESIPKSDEGPREKALFILALVCTTGASSTRCAPVGEFCQKKENQYATQKSQNKKPTFAWDADCKLNSISKGIAYVFPTYHEVPRLVVASRLRECIRERVTQRATCAGSPPGIEIGVMVKMRGGCGRHPSDSKR